MREALIARRKAMAMTQKQVAGLAGITRAAYCHLERGTRNGSERAWLRICGALHWPFERVGELMRQ